MDKAFTKETVLKLLGGMSSEKEIRKYLERFSSDDYRFAVIKVGGAIIRDDLESLVSSLLFLNEVGLTEGDNDGLFVAVGTAVLPEPDPASNPDFLTMRRIKASEASLEAKRQFIEFIRTTMSAGGQDVDSFESFAMKILDTPSYSSGQAVAYKIQIGSPYHSTYIWYINRSAYLSNLSYDRSVISTFTLTEVAA